MPGVRKTNLNPSASLAGRRNLDHPIVQVWVSQEAASDINVGVQVLIRQHPWKEQLCKGWEGSRSGQKRV